MDPCKTVLLVEDDRDIRESLAEILRDEGYAVLEARHGREALDRLRERPASELPCVIVLDLMMPVMDGFAFREAQLQDSTLAGIPVLVVSADSNVRAKASRMRAQGALPKPLLASALVSEVERHCRAA